MDSRVVLDALAPSVPRFAAEAARPAASPPHQPLRRALKKHFPSPRAPPRAPDAAARVLRVSSLPELQRAIAQARAQRRRVRASTGALLSSSNRAHLAKGGLVLDVSTLNKLTFVPSRRVLVAQAAVSLRDLDHAATTHGFSQRVHVPLSPRARSIAAALVTGATGAAGVSEGLLADAVMEVSFVDAFGRLRVYSQSDGTGLFEALKLSLGLFGVIYDVTIRVDLFRRVAHVANSFVSMRSLLAAQGDKSIQRLVERQGAVELIWIPFNAYYRRKAGWDPEDDVMWVRTLRRIAEKPGKDPVLLEEDDDIAFHFLTIPQWLSLNALELAKEGYTDYKPEHAKLFLGLGFEQTAWKLETRPFIQHVSHAVQYHHNADLFPVVDVAAAFPLRPGREDDWCVVQDAWRIVVDRVRECDRRRQYPLNVALKTTFVKASKALLAPNFAHGAPRNNPYSVCVHIVSAKHTLGWSEFAQGVMSEWMRLPGARCKLSRNILAVCPADTIAESLGESLQAFKMLRNDAGVDDIGMFLDEAYADLLGLSEQWGELSSSPVSWTSSAESSGRWREVDPLLSMKAKENGTTVLAGTGMGSKHAVEPVRLPILSSAGLVTSESQSRGWVFDDDGALADEGYEGDQDFTDEESLDDESVDGELRRGVATVRGGQRWYRRRGVRRRKRARYRAPLSPSEVSLLYAYIVIYAVVWLVLFGQPAAQRLGWVSS